MICSGVAKVIVPCHCTKHFLITLKSYGCFSVLSFRLFDCLFFLLLFLFLLFFISNSYFSSNFTFPSDIYLHFMLFFVFGSFLSRHKRPILDETSDSKVRQS